MARLFISYAREDGREFAERLKEALPEHDVWLDRTGILGGDDWLQTIAENIDRSEALLAVWTRSYHGSRAVKTELSRAYRERKTMIPLRFHREAETPPALEGIHYLDCTEARYEASLLELRKRIGALAEEPIPSTGRPEEPVHWDQILARSDKQSGRFIAQHEGAAKQPGRFDRDLYVPRQAAKEELGRFLDGPAPGLILIGDSGVGKTNLLCRWIIDLVDASHAVLAYDCAALADTEIENELARDLSIAGGEGFLDVLAGIDGMASRTGRNLVIIFDSVNDYRGSERNGVQVLVNRINALVSRLAGTHVRVVLTSTTAVWNRLGPQTASVLEGDRYFRSKSDEPFMRLGVFTPEELAGAYPKYQKAFNLFQPFDALAPAIRERLREPVLLRMTAEAYRGIPQPLLAVNLSLGIYQRFFKDRVTPRAEWLVDELAAEMLRTKKSALSITDVARHPRLGPEILKEDTSSIYCGLLDSGILQEWQVDLRTGTVIKFAHTRVAAYALARHLYETARTNVAAAAIDLVRQTADFPLAWEAAKTLLLLGRDDAAFVPLAEARDPEQRELAAEALVEFHADDPKAASRLLERLVDGRSEQGRRTALKAAYNIGPQARDLLLRAATRGEPDLRDLVKNTLYLIWRNESPVGRRSITDTLYLIWRHSPGFTYDFLNALVGEIGLTNPRSKAIIEFVLDLTITIYINHCEEQEVMEKTAALLHELATKRLHLDRFNTGLLGPLFEKMIYAAVGQVFAGQILNWMLFDDVTPAKKFFDLPKQRRSALARMAELFDPASDIDGAQADLAALLQSDLPIFNGSAAMAIALHAAHDFESTQPLIQRLWDDVNVVGRLWILLGFSVLVKDTPPAWVELLEDLTRRYVTEHQKAFLEESARFLGGLDIVLLPLGLAYGKRGAGMPLFETMVRKGLEEGDAKTASRCIAALGAVGFYYPHAVFEVIRPAVAKRDDDEVESALVSTLGTMRTIHFDAVDRFLDQVEAPETLRHGVDVTADIGLVHRYIRVVGHYNNGFHYTLHYPRMRPLSAGALQLLAEAPNPQRFIANYTMRAMQMLRAVKFQVMEWTRPL